MIDLGFTHVALEVQSLERSVAFYARYAAMQVVHRRRDVVWLSDRTRPFVIVLIEVGRVGRALGPISHLGVGLSSRAEVDRLSAEARAEGCLTREPEDSGPPVGYWSLLADPDGHTLELSFGQRVLEAVASEDGA